jgi:DNA-binding NarL/FixJ family response regulator
VALVDDHKLLRQSLNNYIVTDAKDCLVTLQAEDGRALIDQLPTMTVDRIPDIVVLDINMPRLDGYGTLQYLKLHYPSIKVIMLSMFSDDNTIIRCLRLGANAYLVKNVDGDEFIHTIRHVQESGQYYSQYIASLAVSTLKQDVVKDGPIHESGLTKKEKEFLRLVCSEKTYKEIAVEMAISVRTVDIYRDQLFDKLDVNSRVALVLYAIKNKLVEIQ